jgi:Na+/H+ antiporter NhaD/arsenite permease-like protein
MANQIPLELLSNFLSIVIIAFMFYRYTQYKKKIDVMNKLVELKKEDKLSDEDRNFIEKNESEYRHILAKTAANFKLSKPGFILVVGVIFIFFPLQQALIHLNVVVVAFIFMMVDKTHKTNLYRILFDLKK